MDDFSKIISKYIKKKVGFINNYLKKIIQKIKPKEISFIKNSDTNGIKTIYEDNKNQIYMKKEIM